MFIRRVIREFMAPLDDPRVTFQDTGRTQERLLADIREALERIDASRSQLAARAAETRERLPMLDDRARQALRSGREELARQALTQHEVVGLELAVLEQQLQEIDHEQQRLSLAERRLATTIEAQAAREQLLSARYSAAEAQVRINEALAGISEEFAGLAPALDQAEQQAEVMEARATATAGLLEIELPGLHGPEQRLLSGSELTRAVDRRLAALARELDEESLER